MMKVVEKLFDRSRKEASSSKTLVELFLEAKDKKGKEEILDQFLAKQMSFDLRISITKPFCLELLDLMRDRLVVFPEKSKKDEKKPLYEKALEALLVISKATPSIFVEREESSKPARPKIVEELKVPSPRKKGLVSDHEEPTLLEHVIDEIVELRLALPSDELDLSPEEKNPWIAQAVRAIYSNIIASDRGTAGRALQAIRKQSPLRVLRSNRADLRKEIDTNQRAKPFFAELLNELVEKHKVLTSHARQLKEEIMAVPPQEKKKRPANSVRHGRFEETDLFQKTVDTAAEATLRRQRAIAAAKAKKEKEKEKKAAQINRCIPL